jgi:alpha-D-ribose 1-methylphosphonate 5-triphosphate synthase subunit PhnH
MGTAIASMRENHFDFVHHSQQTYKTIMMALAFPGIIRQLVPRSLSIAKPELNFILQPLLTLLDLDTTFSVVCIDQKLQAKVIRYLELNTNSQPRSLQQADFILCLNSSLNGRYPDLKTGSLTHPHDSATVFYLLDRLAGQPEVGAMELNLTGPGIKNVATVYVSGLDPGEVEQWRQDKCNYPLGIDTYLVDRSGNLIGIPRSVNIETSGGW